MEPFSSIIVVNNISDYLVPNEFADIITMYLVITI